ncbi:MAG: hypothetical protein H6814_10795 [Phycisphaeraceae bacterium]|nr:hypothetical protein [Phycisphaeraceae bacterium]
MPRTRQTSRALAVRTRFLVSCCAVAIASLQGCGGSAAQRADRDPLGALADPAAGSESKLRAVAAVAGMGRSGELEPDAAREMLKKVAWGRGNRPNVRNAAIDELFRDDADDTARMLSLMLPTESQWPVIEHVCDLAVESDEESLVPALVRSWSRFVQRPSDEDRPERAALLALRPDQSIEKTVFDVFAKEHDPDDQFGERTRRDAWTLLSRIDPDGALTQGYVAKAPDAPGDPLLADLQSAARDLGAIPLTTEQLDWVEDLRKPEYAEFWSRARKLIAALTPEQREGFELRHAAGVLWASQHRSDWLAASRRELLDQLERDIQDRRHTRRTDGYTDAMAAPRETIEQWRRDLVWGDALLLCIADEAVRDPRIVRELFEQADHDQRDESTEHGGVLDADPDGGFVALSYPPRPAQRAGDNRFVASPELLHAGAAALFHYHFHAQSHNNGDYAGPGSGDLEYAKRFGRTCIVLTFISRNSLGVDCYQPDGARIDLGAISRP